MRTCEISDIAGTDRAGNLRTLKQTTLPGLRGIRERSNRQWKQKTLRSMKKAV